MKDSFAEELLNTALKAGADEAEVYLRRSRSLSVEVNSQVLDTLQMADSVGYSIRIFKDRRLGFSYSTDPSEFMKVAELALQALQFSEPDEFNMLPEKSTPNRVQLFDEQVAELPEKEAIAYVMEMESAALRHDTRINKTRSASGGFGSSVTRILNSKGIDIEYSSSSCSGSIMAVAASAAENQMAWEYQSSRFLKGISFSDIGTTAALRAIQLLGAQKISSLKGSLLLDPSVAVDFVSVLAAAVSAEAVQKKKSMLAGKIGEQVISSSLNLADNGLLDWRLGSSPVDAEGVAVSEKSVVKNGILNGYLYNTYTAAKDGVASTGNASRGGFTGLPSVGVTNMYLEPSAPAHAKDFSTLVSGIKRGIYVTDTMGMHTANPISGEYSVGVSGIWIEDGCLAYPVKEAVISGNILDLFRNVTMVGEEIHFYGNIGASYILAADIDISG